MLRHVFSALLLLAACASLGVQAIDEGILGLDDLTFDKIVDGSRHVFVRFDKEYPWGEAHDAFKEMAKAGGASELIVSSVGVSVKDTYSVNKGLADRFGLSAHGDKLDEKLPLFWLFKKGAPTNSPVEYSGPAKADQLLQWVVQQTGLFIGLKGQVRELDALAKEFMAAAADKRQALVKKAQALADSVTGASPEHIEYYVKTFQRVVDKGADYVQQEAARLRKMASDAGVAAAKKETFTWRGNILGSFVGDGGQTKTEL